MLTLNVIICRHDCYIYIYHMTSITSCHKNRMTTRVITLWRVHVTLLTTSMSTMHFLIEIKLILKTIESSLKGSYGKQTVLHSSSFHIKYMKLAKGSFHKFHMK